MPAETHSHSEPVTADDVLELLATVVHDADGLDPGTPVDALGLDDDLALLSFWDVVAEEFGERTLGEPDIEELAGCRTAIELAETVARSFAAENRPGFTVRSVHSPLSGSAQTRVQPRSFGSAPCCPG